MAKVIYGPNVTLYLGKLGDSVFSICKGTPYVRSHQPVQNQPNSARQQFVQANFKSVTESWPLLTDVQRSLWHQFSSLLHLHADGIASFVRVNCRLLDADHPDLTQVDVPPLNSCAENFVTGFSVSISGANQSDIVWTGPDNDFEFVQIFWRRHRPNQDGINLFWTQVVTERSDSLGYTHVHNLPSDRVLYYRARVIDKKGRVSPWTAQVKVTTL